MLPRAATTHRMPRNFEGQLSEFLDSITRTTYRLHGKYACPSISERVKRMKHRAVSTQHTRKTKQKTRKQRNETEISNRPLQFTTRHNTEELSTVLHSLFTCTVRIGTIGT